MRATKFALVSIPLMFAAVGLLASPATAAEYAPTVPRGDENYCQPHGECVRKAAGAEVHILRDGPDRVQAYAGNNPLYSRIHVNLDECTFNEASVDRCNSDPDIWTTRIAGPGKQLWPGANGRYFRACTPAATPSGWICTGTVAIRG